MSRVLSSTAVQTALLFTFLTCSPVLASTHHVPADYLTITEALLGCASGDTILIAPGTYNESNLVIPTSLTMRGATGVPQDVVLDVQQSGKFFTAENIPELRVEGMSFINQTWGGGADVSDGAVILQDCRFEDGQNWRCLYATNVDLQVYDCVFMGHFCPGQHGPAICQEEGSLTIDNCEFHDFQNNYVSGIALYYSNTTSSEDVSINNCLFQGMESEYGGVCYISADGPSQGIAVNGCRFLYNDCDSYIAQGILMVQSQVDTYIQGCTFASNRGGKIIDVHDVPSLYLTNSTLAYNECFESSAGGVVFFRVSPGSSRVSETIIAFNVNLVSVLWDFDSYYWNNAFHCDNIFGNTDGDWLWFFADDPWTNGNIWADPLFCDGPGGDLSLQAGSPCLLAACGPMGSMAEECAAWDGILAIDDVPADQGGQVRVRWSGHGKDVQGSADPITEYSLWRRIDDPAGGQDLRHPPGSWEHVLSVPAVGDAEYATVMPTLGDSTATDGIYWTTAHLIAHTADPLMFHESIPDSGYSVDNIFPAVPGGLVLAGPGLLAWEECPAVDFQYFSVFASEDEILDEFDTLVAHTVEPSQEFSGDAPAYFLVTATDVAGNRSEAAILQMASGTHDVLPTLLALHGAVPNPFNPTTTIHYDIPEAGLARLAIYDLRGQRVATLVEGLVPAGRREAVWDGTDDEGHSVPSGVYLSRLEFGSEVLSGRMSLVR